MVGGTSPCGIDNYTNLAPSTYTFDLSLGYDTGDTPTNTYLKNIGFQVVIQNILDKHAPFQYRLAIGGFNPCTCDTMSSNYGRQISVVVSKTW